MNLTWERWRLAGVFLISPQQLAGETPALPVSRARSASSCREFLTCSRFVGALLASSLLAAIPGVAGAAEPFRLPTANTALFAPGGEERFFVGTVGKPWLTGTFGSVRSEGWQFHEGLDIRCVQRDKRGEPADPVMATAEGTVAYINTRPGLSNYGNYVVLRHRVDGLEVYSLYAHLSAMQTGLKTGAAVKAGEVIGTMGRTSDTRQGISKDRAHLHFELDLLLNPRFAEWKKKNEPGERNDHGNWNGHNLAGFDPRAVLLAQRAQGARFNLVSFLRAQPELCRVVVRSTDFPFLRRYPALLASNPRAEKEGVAGYELVLSFNGLPLQLIPRADSEIRGKDRIQLLSVNEAEQKRNPAGRLVTQRGGQWSLTESGRRRLELLLF